MAIKLLQPIMRFKGFEPFGMFKRPADERSSEELEASIVAWARQIPEIKEIVSDLKYINKKHWGVVADTIELSQKPATSYLDVDLMDREITPYGYNSLERLMASFPLASSRNPHAMEFLKNMIDTAGKYTTKYFLKEATKTDILIKKGVDMHFQNISESIESLLKEAFHIKQSYENQRQDHFVALINLLVDKDINPTKIPLFTKVLDIVRGRCYNYFNWNDFLNNCVPNAVINENIKTLDDKVKYSYSFGKGLNVNQHLFKEPGDVVDESKLYYNPFDNIFNF